MPLLASDNFNRADGTLGANWGAPADGQIANAPGISSNKVTNTGLGGVQAAEYTATAGPADGYVQCTITHSSTVSNEATGVVWRSSASGFYFMVVNTGLFEFAKNDPGSGNTVIDTDSSTGFADGDVCRVEFVGTSITLKKNGTTVKQWTNSSFTTGNCGIWNFCPNDPAFLDDFEFGTLDQFYTAFQPNAFQHNAFQIYGGTDGTWKTTLGLAKGSIKTVVGTAIASIKTFLGLTR